MIADFLFPSNYGNGKDGLYDTPHLPRKGDLVQHGAFDYEVVSVTHKLSRRELWPFIVLGAPDVCGGPEKYTKNLLSGLSDDEIEAATPGPILDEE